MLSCTGAHSFLEYQNTRRMVPCCLRIGDIPIEQDTPWINRAYESTPTTRAPTRSSPTSGCSNSRTRYGVELEWLPYTLRIPEFMGTVEERTPHFWRKVRYSYMDARRHANAQGLDHEGATAHL